MQFEKGNTIMKRIPALFLAAATAASLMSIPAAAEDNSLVVLGDSITSGYGLDGYTAGDNSSAADSFANQLAASYEEYSNFAVDGRTSGELLTALEDADISAALSGADTVIISIGGNDFLQPMMAALMNAFTENRDLMDYISGLADGTTSSEEADGSGMLSGFLDGNDEATSAIMQIMQSVIKAANSVDVTAVVDNISDILAHVENSAPGAQVVILTVYDPFEGVTGMEMLDVVAREKLAELNSGIADAAVQNGAQVADVASAFKGNAAELTNITHGDIHPSKAGHAAIYSLLCEMTEPSVPTNSDVPVKGSPDTGAEGIAVVAGIAALSAAGLFFSRRR